MKTRLFSTILLLVMSAAGVFGDVLRVGSGSPYSSITSALAAASPGDEIWVSAGTYREAELIIPSGVSVYGGFTGSETQLSERNFAQNVTILDGSGSHRVATVSGRLDGFTLRNGRTGDNGGGAYIKGGGTLANCIAFANEAGYDGGAVFAEDGGTVKNSLLTGNRAGNNGAAISGLGAYSAVHVTATGNEFTNAPEIKKVLETPAPIVAGQQLNVAEPDITKLDEVDPRGSTVLLKGWELDGHAISMPYTVTYADNGKKLRFWAANAVGVGMSNEVTVTVTWTVTSAVQLITPKAVCEGTTLAGAGITEPSFSPAPADGVTYEWSIDGTPVSGLDYVLQYTDNGKLLTCEVRNSDGSITGATTPAVRLAVMKAPEILLSSVASLSIEDGEPLCLPTPVVISNGSDITAQGWKWTTDGNPTTHDFNSCDKATPAMNGAKLYYTAENGCTAGVPVTKDYLTTLTVTNPVGEFLQTASALCAGMTLGEGIAFADGGNTGDYYIGDTQLGNAGTTWDAVKTTELTTAHNLQVLRFSYNGGKSERRLTFTVHAVPAITTDPAEPGSALCLGDAHTLTVEAKGDNLSYQWERSVNSTDGADGDWSNVPGATTAACRLTADATAYYRCTVEGICVDKSPVVASGKITSALAKLTVNDRPVIPMVTFDAGAGELDICEGIELLTILTAKTPTLTGTPATAEGWTLGGVKVAAGYKASATDNGKVLGYWASNGCGERTITFPTGILAVTSRPELLQSPADVSAEENSSVRLSVLTGAGVKYQWYVAGTNPADPTDGASVLPGKTTASCVFTAAELTDADLAAGKKETKYYCRITALTDVCKGRNDAPATIDPTAPAYVLSDVATVTVNRRTTDITITSQPDAFPETCAGTDKTITVKATGRGGLACKWYSGSTEMTDPDNGTITTTVSAITPAPSDALAADKQLVSEFTPNAAGTYYCIITSTDNPGGVRSTQSVLTIHALPVLTDISAAEHTQTLCRGTDLSLRVSATGTAVSYEWQRSTDGGTNYTALGETDSRLRTAVTDDAVYRCVVKVTCMEKVAGYDATAGGIPTSAVTVTMAMKPSVAAAGNFTPAAFSKCEGEAIALSDANVTVDDNHKAVAAAGRWWTLGGQQVANDYVVTRNDNGKTVGYSATNECGTTTVTFAAMKLTVDEKPQVTQDPADVSTTEDSRVRLSVAASGSHLTYQWQKKAHGNGENAWTDIAAADEPSAITPALSFTAANITAGAFDGADVLTDYRCRVGTTNACDGTTVYSAAATVTVTRQKSVVSIRRQPASYEVCNSAAAYSPGFTVEVAGSGHFIYKWYNITDPTTPVRTEPATGSTDATSDTYTPAKGDAAAGTYYCVVTSTDDDEGVQSQAVTLTVSLAPEVIDITPAAAKICEGGSVTLGVDAEGSALTYQWYQQKGVDKDPDTDTKKGTAATYTPVGLDATARFYCIVGSGSVCTETAASATVEVTVEKAPKITTQPVSRTVCGGTGINLTVVAVNADRYEWYYNGTPKGGNSATLSDVTDGGVYTCVVSKTGGVCGEVTSVPALITAAGMPTVNLGSRDNLTACQGDLVTLPTPEVETGGSVIVPERTGWYLSGDADQKLVSSFIAGNSNVTYNYKLTYKCSADATQGDEQVLIAGMPTLAITVSTPLRITQQPQSLTSCTLAALTIAASGTGSETAGNYQWYRDGVILTGKTGKTLAAADLTADGTLHTYTCLVKGTCNTVESAPAVVEKIIAVSGGAIAVENGKSTVCPGESVTLTMNGVTGDDPQYVWRIGNATSGAVVGNAATLTVSPTATTTYHCTVSNGCTATVSKQQQIAVTQAPTVTGVLKAVEKKEGETVAQTDIQTTAPASAGNTLTWTLNDTPVKFGYTVSAADNGKVFKVTATNACGLSATLGSTSTLTVLTAPQILEQPRGVTLCEGAGTVTLTVKATGSGLNYLWMKDGVPVTNAPGTGGNDVVAGAKGATLTLTKPAAARSGVYTCSVSGSGGDAVVSAPAVVTVNAKVALATHPMAATICKGESATLGVKATGDGLTYQWYSGANSSPATLINGATSPTLTTAPGANTYYKCIVNGCSAVSSNVVMVTVKTPAGITKQPKDQVGVCTYSALSVVSGGTSPKYLWYKDGAALASGTGYKTPDYTPASDGVYYCQVSVDNCGSVMSGPAVVRKSVAVSGTLTAKADRTTLCKGESVTLSATGVSGDGLSYEWKTGGTTVGYGTTVSVSPSATADYVCTAKDACGGTKSSTALKVTVKDPVVITVQPVGGGVFNATKPLSVSTSGNVTGYEWYKDGVIIGGATSASYPVPNAVGVHTYYCLVKGTCGNVTSTAVQVSIGQKPTFTGDNQPVDLLPQVGKPYTYPAPPVVAMNNCEMVSQGWIVEGAGEDADHYLDPMALAALTDYEWIAYRVKYRAPDGTTGYADSKKMGLQYPWDVPTMTGTPGPGPVYVDATSASAKWTMPTTFTVVANKTLITESWVYGEEHMPIDNNTVVDLDKHARQPLYKKVVYKLPDGSAGGTVYFYAGVLRPWKTPVFHPYDKQTWDVCTQKTFIASGHQFPTVPYEANECTITGHEWVIENSRVKEGDNPTAAQDKKTLQYIIKYRTPKNENKTLSIDIATLRTASAVPILILNEVKAGDPKVQVIGAKVDDVFRPTVTNGVPYTLINSLGVTMEKADQGKTIVYTAYNGCGAATADGKIELSGKIRGHDYYKGTTGTFEILETLEGMSVYANGRVNELGYRTVTEMRHMEEGWTPYARAIAMKLNAEIFYYSWLGSDGQTWEVRLTVGTMEFTWGNQIATRKRLYPLTGSW